MLVLTRKRDESIIGQRFGRLLVVSLSPTSAGSNGGRLWVCECDCGREKLVRRCDLTRGFVSSCGCYRRDLATTHGMSRSAEYGIWWAIRGRCGNPNHAEFHRYGAKGVRVCDRWERSFPDFLADMGKRPSRRHQIDRIDNSRGYEPGNCRWATPEENTNNRSITRFLVIGGVRKSLSQYAREFGISIDVLGSRLARGWSPERALSQPVTAKPRRKRNAGPEQV